MDASPNDNTVSTCCEMIAHVKCNLHVSGRVVATCLMQVTLCKLYMSNIFLFGTGEDCHKDQNVIAHIGIIFMFTLA